MRADLSKSYRAALVALGAAGAPRATLTSVSTAALTPASPLYGISAKPHRNQTPSRYNSQSQRVAISSKSVHVPTLKFPRLVRSIAHGPRYR